ncbi:MAG: Cna B-type domain-containing protein [Lachnospiraceae bacterium]|nr:Cna B-type domain-containing protein [Lachnospiraceae bacterium]
MRKNNIFKKCIAMLLAVSLTGSQLLMPSTHLAAADIGSDLILEQDVEATAAGTTDTGDANTEASSADTSNVDTISANAISANTISGNADITDAAVTDIDAENTDTDADTLDAGSATQAAESGTSGSGLIIEAIENVTSTETAGAGNDTDTETAGAGNDRDAETAETANDTDAETAEAGNDTDEEMSETENNTDTEDGRSENAENGNAEEASVTASLTAEAVSGKTNEYQIHVNWQLSNLGDNEILLALCMDETIYSNLLNGSGSEPETTSTATCVIKMTDGTMVSFDKTVPEEGMVRLSCEYTTDENESLNSLEWEFAIKSETIQNESTDIETTANTAADTTTEATAGSATAGTTIGSLAAEYAYTTDESSASGENAWVNAEEILLTFDSAETEAEAEAETETAESEEIETDTESEIAESEENEADAETEMAESVEDESDAETETVESEEDEADTETEAAESVDETDIESETESETEADTENVTETKNEIKTKTETENENESESEIDNETSEPETDEDEIEEAGSETDTKMESEAETEDPYAASVTADVTGTAARNSLLRNAGIATVASENSASSIDMSEYITGASFSLSEIESGSVVKVSIDYQIYSQILTSAGTTTLTYQLPTGINPISEFAGKVYDGTTEVGTYTITKDGKITIVFNDTFVNSGSTITGNISFWSTITSSSSDEDTTLTFSFSEENEVTTSIVIKKETEAESDQTETSKKTDLYVDKSYTCSTTSDDKIIAYYTVVIGSLYGTDGNAITTFTDSLTNYLNNSSVTSVTMNVKDIVVKDAGGTDYSDYISYDSGNSQLSLNSGCSLPALSEGGYYTITYTVEYSGTEALNGAIDLKNSAYASTSKNNGSDSTDINLDHTYISKTSSYSSSSDQIIWTITLNNFGGDLNGYTLSDSLVKEASETGGTDEAKTIGAVSVTEYLSDGSTVTWSGISLPFTIAKVDGTYSAGTQNGNTLYVNDTTDKFVVTYSTDVSEDGFYSAYENTATLGDGGTNTFTEVHEQSVKHDSGTLDKSYVSPDDSSEEIVYETDVNGDETTTDSGLRNYSWTSVISVPSDGIKTGSYYEDNITDDAYSDELNQYGTRIDIVAHYITGAQLEALTVTYTNGSGISGNTLDSGAYTIQVKNSDGDWETYTSANSAAEYTSFRIYFNDTLSADEYKSLTISYQTTADLNEMSNGDVWTFTNSATFSQDGAYVSSTDSNRETSGGYIIKTDMGGSSTHTYAYDECKGILYYRLQINTNSTFKDNGTIVIKDTLPEGTTLYTSDYEIATGSNHDASVTGTNVNDTSSHVKLYYGLGASMYQTVNLYNPYVADYDVNTDVKVTYDEETRELTITIPQDTYYGYLDTSTQKVSLPISIYYAAQITDVLGKNTSKDYTNHVEMSMGGSTYSDSVTDTVTSSNISKSINSDVTTGDQEKAYKVLINPSAATLNNGEAITVTDTINYGRYITAIALVQGSFHLYKLKSDGTMGSEISTSLYTVTYEDTGSQFIMTITLNDSTAYVLEYEYSFTVDEDTFMADNGKEGEFYVTNTITLSGSYMESSSSKVTDEQEAGDSSATAQTNKYVTLAKVDKDNQIIYLSGAIFELQAYIGTNSDNYEDDSKWKTIKTYVTGQNGTGKVLISELKSGTAYRLKEIEAPTNYKLNTGYYYFYYNSATSAQIAAWPQGLQNVINALKGDMTITFKDEADTTTYTSVAIQKNWKDAKGNTLTGSSVVDGDGNIITSIEVALYRTTDETETDIGSMKLVSEKTTYITPDDGGNWYYSFNNLDDKDEDENVYYYYVVETGKYTATDSNGNTVDVTAKTLSENYTVTRDSEMALSSGTVTITNTKNPDKINVSVTKKWADNAESETSVEVSLYKSSIAPEVEETEVANMYVYYVSADGTQSRGDDSNGNYTVTVKSSGSSVKYIVSNTESWVTLYESASYTVDGSEKMSVLGMQTDDGIEFLIPNVTGDVALYVTVNYIYGGTYSASVENADEITGMAELPEDASLVTGITDCTVTLSGSNNWTYEWEDLPDDGFYYVVEGENGVIDGYSSSYTYEYQDGGDSASNIKTVTITNTKDTSPDTTELTVTKSWADNNNELGTRPSSITMQLYRSESSPDTLSSNTDDTGLLLPSDAQYMGSSYDRTLSDDGDGNWAALWTELPVSNGSGTNYYYYIVESSVEGYVATYAYSYVNGSSTEISEVIVTNTASHITSVTVKKNWQVNGGILSDEDAAKLTWSATVQLYYSTSSNTTGQTETIPADAQPYTTESVSVAGETEVYTAELSNSNDWTFSWENLPVADDLGNLYYYYVKEIETTVGSVITEADSTNAAYTITRSSVSGTSEVILNSVTTTDISVTKEWLDAAGETEQIISDSVKAYMNLYRLETVTDPYGAEVTTGNLYYTEKIALGTANAGVSTDTGYYSADGWTYTWTYLPSGTYYVEEDYVTVGGYTAYYKNADTSLVTSWGESDPADASVTEGTITIVNKKDSTKITVEKIWETEAGETTPETVVMELYRTTEVPSETEPTYGSVTVDVSTWLFSDGETASVNDVGTGQMWIAIYDSNWNFIESTILTSETGWTWETSEVLKEVNGETRSYIINASCWGGIASLQTDSADFVSTWPTAGAGETVSLTATLSAKSTADEAQTGSITVKITDWVYSDGVKAEAPTDTGTGIWIGLANNTNSGWSQKGDTLTLGNNWTFTWDDAELVSSSGVSQSYVVFYTVGSGWGNLYSIDSITDGVVNGSSYSSVSNGYTQIFTTVDTSGGTDVEIDLTAVLTESYYNPITIEISDWFYSDGATDGLAAADDSWVWVAIFSGGQVVDSATLTSSNMSWTAYVPNKADGAEQTYTILYSHSDDIDTLNVNGDKTTISESGGIYTVAGVSDTENVLSLSAVLTEDVPTIPDSDIDITVEVSRWKTSEGVYTTADDADGGWMTAKLVECDQSGVEVSGGTETEVTLSADNDWKYTVTLPGVKDQETKYYKIIYSEALLSSDPDATNTIQSIELTSGSEIVSGDQEAYGFAFSATLVEKAEESSDLEAPADGYNRVYMRITEWRDGSNAWDYNSASGSVPLTNKSLIVYFTIYSFTTWNAFSIQFDYSSGWVGYIDIPTSQGDVFAYYGGVSMSGSGLSISLETDQVVTVSGNVVSYDFIGYYSYSDYPVTTASLNSASLEGTMTANLVENTSILTTSSNDEPSVSNGMRDTWDATSLGTVTLGSDYGTEAGYDSNGWSYTWDNLDKYDSNGNLYYYYFVEKNVPGYTSSYEYEVETETDAGGNTSKTGIIKSVTVTNRKADAVSITVTKEWVDWSSTVNQGGDTTYEYDDYYVIVELYRDGEATGKTVILNSTYKDKTDSDGSYGADGWSYTWGDLEGGYTYTVKELSVKTSASGGTDIDSSYLISYSTGVDGSLIITNTKTTSITVTKKWLDASGQESSDCPESLIVQLYTGSENGDTGSPYEATTVTLSSANNWSYEWTDLPVGYYYVEELVTEGLYTTVYQNKTDSTEYSSACQAATDGGDYIITNKKVDTEITVTKTWSDGSSATRPTEVTVQLYRSTTAPKVMGSITVDISEWVDDSGSALVPSNVSSYASFVFTLYESGSGNAVGSAALSKSNGWSYTFENLTANQTYMIGYTCISTNPDETALAKVKDSGDSYLESGTIEATSTVAGTTVEFSVQTAAASANEIAEPLLTGSATGIDSEVLAASSGLRYATDGVKVGDVVTLNDSSSWSNTWSNLDKYDADGNLYYYYVVETAVPDGYTAYYSYVYSGGTIQSIKIKNSTEQTSAVTVKKKWSGFSSESEYADYAVSVALCKDGAETGSVKTLDSNNSWTASWTDLEAGYTYSVVETAVENGSGTDITNTFDVTYSILSDDGEITVTNTKKTTEISVEKKWGDDAGSHTDDTVTMQLYRSTTAPESGSITVDVKEWLDSFGASSAPLTTWDGGIWLGLYDEDWDMLESVNLAVDNDWTNTFSDVILGKTYYVQFAAWGNALSSVVFSDGTTGGSKTVVLAGNIEIGLKVTYASGYSGTGTSAGSSVTYTDGVSTTDMQTGSGIRLSANGEAVDGCSVKLGNSSSGGTGSWSYTWSNLDLYDSSGNQYYYYVVEISGKDGYSASYEYETDAASGMIQKVTVTNSIEVVKVRAKKVWDSSFDTDEYANYVVTVKLYNNGTEVTGSETVLSSDNDWTCYWKVEKGGNYSVEEVSVQAGTDTDYDGTYDSYEDVKNYSVQYSYGGTTSSTYSEVKVSEAGTITITNSKQSQGITLPGTGSKYPLIFYGLGLSFLLVSTTWMLYAFKKKKKYRYAGKGGETADSS